MKTGLLRDQNGAKSLKTGHAGRGGMRAVGSLINGFGGFQSWKNQAVGAELHEPELESICEFVAGQLGQVWAAAGLIVLRQTICGGDTIGLKCVHIDTQITSRGTHMETQKVGIREFRADLAEYIASSTPIAVTRHGQTVGYFIPTQGQLEADVAALKKASKTLDKLLERQSVDEDSVVSEFKAARRKDVNSARKQKAKTA